MFVRAWLGIAVQGFPEFEQFCIAGFPASTPVLRKSAAYAIPPRPRAATSLMIGHLARFYTSFPYQQGALEWPVFTPRHDCFFDCLLFTGVVDAHGIERGLDVGIVSSRNTFSLLISPPLRLSPFVLVRGFLLAEYLEPWETQNRMHPVVWLGCASTFLLSLAPGLLVCNR
jgi:hypothetical protein